MTCTDPDSPVSEQYRKLKTVLLKMTKKDFRNTVLVTSALSGEGKSITSANLAVMLAREYGQTVLLVDADLRKPSLGNYLGLKPVYGLADSLYDGIDLGRAIVKTGFPKLSFLSAGKKVEDPAELLSSHRMKDLLTEIKHRYADRYIIIDTPPALLYAETLALSALVDGVLIVVKEGVATLKGIGDMLETLKGALLLGIVYNDMSTASLDGSYSHYSKYYKKNQKQ
ncbi:MAG TPA: XrtA-associated tyrosine autokinase [Nitrospirota bacterium]|nr:XrtA-associated tyrosine autokinase [Nitrospirota bacterium]